MRLIDADALLQEAKRLSGPQTGDGWDNWGVYALIERQPTVTPEPGWISVEERLPEDGVFVLVCNDDGHMMVAKYESVFPCWEYKYTNYDHDVWDDDEQGPVCWWMPLPDAPKEET